MQSSANFSLKKKKITAKKGSRMRTVILSWAIILPSILLTIILLSKDISEKSFLFPKNFKSTGINKEEELKPKIAYIFAGSVRSFICPKVHWSLKSHLIDALGGDPHVFIRVAVDDNKNIKTGLGTLWKPLYKEGEVEETLKILNPRVVQNFSFSTQIEEMKRNYPGTAHTVFRENDQRRYSMFYHRCMAYKLMLQYERENHMRFDWVLLVRLDAGWLEPMLPIQSYANDRVWITETGFDLFNDQFMMIPRQFSDYLYDLNTKVKKEVYCLGGPDVEKWKCNVTESLARGRDEQLSRETINYCCSDIKKSNRFGFSERIHLRHLLEGKIPVSLGRFPVFLTRLDNKGVCFPECMRIMLQHKQTIFNHQKAVYPYLVDDSWVDTRSVGISARDKVLCSMQHHPIFPWKPISAMELHKLSKNTTVVNYSLDYSKSLVSQLERVHPSILLPPVFTTTWRIHPTWNMDKCWTFSYRNQTLIWDFCHNHVLTPVYRRELIFDERQLFFLQVSPFPQFKQRAKIPGVPYPASFLESGGNVLNPDSLVENLFSPSIESAKTTRVMIRTADSGSWNYHGRSVLCLTVSGFNTQAVVSMEKCTEDEKNPNQLFYAVKPLAVGSHHQSVVGRLKVAAKPILCVGRAKQVIDGFLKIPSGDKLGLTRCDRQGNSDLVEFEFELIN